MNEEISSSCQKLFRNEVEIQYRLSPKSSTERVLCYPQSSIKLYCQKIHLKPTISAFHRKETIVIKSGLDDHSSYESVVEKKVKPAQKLYVTVLYHSNQEGYTDVTGSQSFSEIPSRDPYSSATIRRDPVMASPRTDEDSVNVLGEVKSTKNTTVKLPQLDDGTFLQGESNVNIESRIYFESSLESNQQMSRLVSTMNVKEHPIVESQFDEYSSSESTSSKRKYTSSSKGDKGMQRQEMSYDGNFTESPGTSVDRSSQMTRSSSFTIVFESEELTNRDKMKTESSIHGKKKDSFVEESIFILRSSSQTELQGSHNWGPDPAPYMELLAFNPGAFFISVGYIN